MLVTDRPVEALQFDSSDPLACPGVYGREEHGWWIDTQPGKFGWHYSMPLRDGNWILYHYDRIEVMSEAEFQRRKVEA